MTEYVVVDDLYIGVEGPCDCDHDGGSGHVPGCGFEEICTVADAVDAFYQARRQGEEIKKLRARIAELEAGR